MKKTQNGDNGDKRVGNSDNSTRSSQRVHFVFTFNNYHLDDIPLLETWLRELCVSYAFQREIAPTTGTPHLQGVITLKKRARITEILYKGVHWDENPVRKVAAAYQYATKLKTREPDTLPFCYNYTPVRPIKTIENDNLKQWQLDIIAIISSEADNRTIHWYWEPDGNMGKTTFCKYLSVHHGAIPLEGKKNDILYCAAKYESDIYVYDLERSMETFVSYGAIEKIKNGYFMCSKYESKPIIRNCPHVLIFANFEPNYEALSADRWNVNLIS